MDKSREEIMNEMIRNKIWPLEDLTLELEQKYDQHMLRNQFSHAAKKAHELSNAWLRIERILKKEGAK